MVFKNFTGDIKEATSLTSRLTLFEKSFKSIGEDIDKLNGKGKIFTAIFKSSDSITLNNFNNALKNGSNYSDAFITHMKNASLEAQDTARQIINLKTKMNLLNQQYKNNAINEQTYNARMEATQTQLTALTAQTQTLTLKQRLLAGATQMAVMAFNMLKMIAVTAIVTGIIAGITKVVNQMSELQDKIDDLIKLFERGDHYDCIIKNRLYHIIIVQPIVITTYIHSSYNA